MNILELFLVAIGLSMDAFAVAVTIGLTQEKFNIKKALIVGLYFGAFQAGMPIIGYLGASFFPARMFAFDSYIVFAILTYLGGKMIYDAIKNVHCKDRTCQPTPCPDRECPAGRASFNFGPKQMIPLAVATSIDALAVGISFAFVEANVNVAVSFIGITTLLLSVAGVKIGLIFGLKFKSKAVFVGGAILVAMGVHVLVEGFL
ncbi:MAG: manganese efflux pump MntP family protein [Defluviitaleaceae bacterium]|nr:manganese efflux pump MntP family protein [Defluviitaleaceae bacterium]